MNSPGKLFACAVTLALLTVTGCGSGPRLNNVYGKVTYQGLPLRDAIIKFIPAEGRPAQALTNEAGEYDYVMYDKNSRGLMTGDYDVVVTYLPTEPRKSALDPPPPPPPELQAGFEKYGKFDKPQFKVTVTNGQRTLNIDLP
jgi:hypothetical protein